MSRNRALARSRRHRILAGVCGGLADWVGWDPMLVRVLYVLVSVFPVGFPRMLVYLVLWLIMPEADREPRVVGRSLHSRAAGLAKPQAGGACAARDLGRK